MEDFESRPHQAVTFVVERGKERQEWNERKLPKAPPGYSGGRLPGRSMEEEGRGEGEEGKESEDRRVSNEIIKEVIKGIQKMAFEESCKNEGKENWRAKPRTKMGIARRLRLSKKRKAGKKATKWQNHGKRSNTWKTLVERRRMEGKLLEGWMSCTKVPELVVNERMSQGEKGEKNQK